MAGGSVLIVSGDRKLSRELAEKIEGVGARVLLAEDWVQGNKLAHTRRPDLIILGMNFPGREGLNAIRTLQESVETMLIPVIYLSGEKNPIEERETLDRGAVAYFGGPLDIEEIVREAARYI